MTWNWRIIRNEMKYIKAKQKNTRHFRLALCDVKALHRRRNARQALLIYNLCSLVDSQSGLCVQWKRNFRCNELVVIVIFQIANAHAWWNCFQASGSIGKRVEPSRLWCAVGWNLLDMRWVNDFYYLVSIWGKLGKEEMERNCLFLFGLRWLPWRLELDSLRGKTKRMEGEKLKSCLVVSSRNSSQSSWWYFEWFRGVSVQLQIEPQYNPLSIRFHQNLPLPPNAFTKLKLTHKWSSNAPIAVTPNMDWGVSWF